MPYFPAITVNGQTYDLAHLDPLTLQVQSEMAKKTLRVGVRFSNHCFTNDAASATSGMTYLTSSPPSSRD